MGDDALSAGAVARRLGVAVTTLRTWHQRYGLGPSRHVPGRHRRYTPQDMDRLEVMLRLTAQGVTPAEAAAWARRAPSVASVPGTPAPGTAAPGSGAAAPASGATAPASGIAAPASGATAPASGIAAPASGAAAPCFGSAAPGSSAAAPGYSAAPASGSAAPASGSAAPAPGAARHGGGQAIPLGEAQPAARGLARAAMRLDSRAMSDILATAVAERGVVSAWTDVAVPVLVGIGERFQATQRFVEVEHLLSRCVTEVLGAVPRPPGASSPRVLLAAADEEQHTLALEALAAALAEKGVPARLLGARVPPRALADAITRTGPAAVVLWSQITSTGDPTQLTRVAAHPHRPLLLTAAGPGWPTDLPADVSRLTTLPEAVAVLAA